MPKFWYREEVVHRGPVSEVQLDMEQRRVYMTPDHTLVINDITLNDSAIYFCHGDTSASRFNYLLDGKQNSRY